MAQLFLRKASFNFKAAIVSKKINNFHFFPYKSLCDQIWPWRKMGQGQPRDIIWTILVVFTYTMLHTKFQGHWSVGSGEEDFLRFLPYMGMAAILVMWPNSFVFIFIPILFQAFIWTLVPNCPTVFEKNKFELWNLSDLWPRSKNDLDLEYSPNFINSFSRMLQASLRPKAAIVSKK